MGNFIERLQYFMTQKGINDNQMTIAAGLSIGLLGKAKTSGKGMSSVNIEKILLAYPELSPNWLLTGRGEMLKTKNTSDTKNVEIQPVDSCKVTKNKSNTQENSIKKISVSYSPSIGTPYYDVDFIGGFSEVFNDQTALPTCNIVVPGLEKATVWCNVTGHSMEPRINHGDIIALRECTLQDVQYGEIYAVVLDTLRTIKMLRKGSAPDKLLYVPINKTDYDEQEFSISRIKKIFEVIASISKFF